MATSAPPSRRSLFSILACVCVFALLILLFDDDACSETRFIGRQLITPNHHHSLLTRSFLDGSPHPGFSPFVFVTYPFRSRTRMYRAIEKGGGGGDQHPQVRHEFRRKTNRILSAQKRISCCRRRCFPPSLWRAFCCVLCFVSCACLFVIADDDDLIIILHILYDDVFSFFFGCLYTPFW